MDEKEKIIMLHEKLIYKIASKFHNVPTEDLYQAGVIGIIKAYNNYKDNGQTKFTTYAYKYIFGEMYELSSNIRTIRLNKDILKLYKKIEQAKSSLAQKFGCIPSTSQVAQYLEFDENIIANVYSCTNSIMSLDVDSERPAYEVLPDTTPTAINSSYIDIQDSLNTLNSEERQIIDYRYFRDYTQTETAKVLGISQVKVSRYEKKSLNKMYNYLSL